jgi:hypothetical protein
VYLGNDLTRWSVHKQVSIVLIPSCRQIESRTADGEASSRRRFGLEFSFAQKLQLLCLCHFCGSNHPHEGNLYMGFRTPEKTSEFLQTRGGLFGRLQEPAMMSVVVRHATGIFGMHFEDEMILL